MRRCNKVDVKWANVDDDNTQDFLYVSWDGQPPVVVGFEDSIPASSACGLEDGLRSIGVYAYHRRGKWGNNYALFIFSKTSLPVVARKSAFDFIEDTL